MYLGVYHPADTSPPSVIGSNCTCSTEVITGSIIVVILLVLSMVIIILLVVYIMHLKKQLKSLAADKG